MVHTSNKGGHGLTKRFRVFTNDPKAPITNLVVTGNIIGFVDVQPKRARFSGQVGNVPPQEIRIIPQDGHLFRIKELKVNRGDYVEYDIKPAINGKEPPKDGYTLTVKCTRKEKGSFGDLIVVKTDLKDKPVINIPVNGRLFDPPQKKKGRTAK